MAAELDGSAELMLSRWTEIQMEQMTRRVPYKIETAHPTPFGD
jgi:hypothetical protein